MLGRIWRTEKIKVIVNFFQLIHKLQTKDDRVDFKFLSAIIIGRDKLSKHFKFPTEL